MKADIIKICDKISVNEDISMSEFETLQNYITKANEFKNWNTDDVFSEFVLAVRMQYDRDRTVKEKEWRIYANIKRAIQKVSIFDNTGTLNNPAPIALCWYEIEDKWWQPSDISQETLDEFLNVDELFEDWLEREIYETCIKWGFPVLYIAKEYWKSAEWGRVVKERVLAKIRNYIEKKPK